MMRADTTASWSLRKRLALGLVLTTLLPVLLFSVAMLWSQWQRDISELRLRLDANARLSASVIDDFLESQLAGVRLQAEQASAGAGVSDDDLARLLTIYPAMLRALHVDGDGNVAAMRDVRQRLPSRIPVNVANEEWFKATRNQYRAHISDVFKRPIYGDEVVVAISAPVFRKRQIESVLQAAIPVESIARLSADSLARRRLELLLLDRGNHVVYAGPGLRWKPLDDAGDAGMMLRNLATTADREGQMQRRDNLLRTGGGAYVEAVTMRNQWTLALVAPRETVLAPLTPRLLLLGTLLLITLLGMSWALWRQWQLLRASIGYLVGSLRGYALGGQLEDQAKASMPDEMRPLMTGIGELATRLNRAYRELQQVLGEREATIEERTESLQRAVAELDRLSRTDALTGCLNYRGFAEQGKQLWQAAQAGDLALSVLALDIDHFKRYNDHYGHAAGDGVLRRFAGAVRSALLHADDVLARSGGEEFVVFLPGSGLEQARKVAERVCQRVRSADIEHAGAAGGFLTVSIGVAAKAPGDVDLDDVLKRADKALYRAKAEGRDRVSL
ncbi:MAG: GGDEF domain-containing protein [Xanthomonadaceae bacterium]|nr:GGDEF domain-containing protein [Xanthomonadaceae bacterium]